MSNGKNNMRELDEYARDNGWSVELTRNNHRKYTKPGRQAVYGSLTSSDVKAWYNIRAKLRRADRVASEMIAPPMVAAHNGR